MNKNIEQTLLVGRPTKMTDLTVQKLEEAFAMGCTDEEACIYAGICKQTLYNFQDKNVEFLDRKELLKMNPILKARRTIVEALAHDPRLALQFLERKKRDEFGLQQASHEGFEPIRILIDDDCECKKQKALAG